MIVSRNQLKELRSRRDSQINYESKTSQNTIKQEQPQTTHSVSFHSNRAMSELNSNSLIKRNNKLQNFTSHKFTSNYNQQTSLRHCAQMRRKYEKMSFDIDLRRRNLKQFIVAMPNSISVRQIYSLNLSQNYIREILPTLLVPFESLKELNLSGNQLEKISFPYNRMKLRTLQIDRNVLANLNLQHLKYLQWLNAAHNKLIFITLPESLKVLKLDHNLLSNMYFIEKCQQLQTLSINFNFIYDFTFNSINQLDSITKKQIQCPRFYKLHKIQCSHNKITHLNGFFNIKYLKELSLQFNQITLSRQNLNELFHLENVENLNLTENPLEGTYAISTTLEFLIKKLPKLQTLNQQPKNLFETQSKRSQAQGVLSDKDHDNGSINDESSIKEKSEGIQNSGQKPFRLFLDEDLSPENFKQSDIKMSPRKSSKKHRKTKEWIYTLGDTESKMDQNDSEIFKLMTLCHQQTLNQPNQNKTILPRKDFSHKSSEKVIQLKQQVLNGNKKVEISLSNIELVQEEFELDYESRNILKVIFEMSFIPPVPLKHLSNSQIVSKRLDQDTDQYALFSKLFEKRKGILYLKKICLVQDTDTIFGFEEHAQSYELNFFNHPQVNRYYAQMCHSISLLGEVFKKEKGNSMDIQHYLSPAPNSFGCHHILVRNLRGKQKAFEKRHFMPVCYLVESKNI